LYKSRTWAECVGEMGCEEDIWAEVERQTSMQNVLSSSLLSKNLKMKIYRTIILPVVLYGCETWLSRNVG
jgi:hypothetical protein